MVTTSNCSIYLYWIITGWRDAMNRKYGTNKNVFDLKSYAGIYILSFLIVIYVTGALLKMIHTDLWVKDMVHEGIHYDSFREMKVSENVLDLANERITHILKRHPNLASNFYMNGTGYLTFSMIARKYDLTKQKLVDEKTFLRGIGRLSATRSYLELYEYYRAILSDITYFPVPKIEASNVKVSYVDSWFGLRTYGGKRRHEGTDLMSSNNIRGYLPVVSITEGTVENIGWLDKGGYRIGIRSPSGGYFYYAHLYSYAPEIKKGDKVIAGQLLGFMGDSGYGKEGTIGQFGVHLHLGIYVNSNSGEMSINPYRILKMLETHQLSYKKSK